jgi:hypothetical protein
VCLGDGGGYGRVEAGLGAERMKVEKGIWCLDDV